MPDEQTEQVAEVAPEQDTPFTEQVEPVAPEGNEPVAAVDSEPVAESEVTFDFSTDDGILAAAEQNPTLKGLLERYKKDGENTGRQRYEAELKRQQASDEVLAQRLEMVAKVKGWDADDEDLKQILAASHAPVIEREQHRIAQVHFEAAKSTFVPEAQAAIDLAWQQAGDDIEAKNSVIGQLWQYRDQSSRQSAVTELSLESVPEGSKLHQEIQAHVQQEVEKELKAREDAANRLEPSPRSTVGTAPGGSRDQEIDEILRTQRPSSSQYQEAYREKYGFALPVR